MSTSLQKVTHKPVNADIGEPLIEQQYDIGSLYQYLVCCTNAESKIYFSVGTFAPFVPECAVSTRIRCI